LRRRGVFLVFLAVVNGVLESVAALLVFSLVNTLTKPDSVQATFLVRDLYRFSPASKPTDFPVYLAAFVATFYLAKNGLVLAEAYLQHRFSNDAATETAVQLLSG